MDCDSMDESGSEKKPVLETINETKKKTKKRTAAEVVSDSKSKVTFSDDRAEDSNYDPANVDFDHSAYKMYHAAQTGAPCLSFDVIHDGLGDKRETYPLSCLLAAGTQAAHPSQNHLLVLHMSEMSKIVNEEDEEMSDSEDACSDEDGERGTSSKKKQLASLQVARIPHPSSINRVRCTTIGGQTIAATWGANRKVHTWNLSQHFPLFDDASALSEFNTNASTADNKIAALQTYGGYRLEGYALDWSPTTEGRLLTGDCAASIVLWEPREGSWKIDEKPYRSHTASVEDLQWSPCEPTVFASCSVDRSIKVWDTRAKRERACQLTNGLCHESDINVISWSRGEPYIMSGGDDACVKVWDLRQFRAAARPVATFKYHTAPITSVEWNPNDTSVFAASGEDNKLTMWDLAVEKDTEVKTEDGASDVKQDPDLPDQLLFVHEVSF